ncbi:MAG: dephospho-CoA kinase [Rhodospirillales bacterium]|jgi:dephospho-CoA kinase|nr:dephospho-CoA kinase [Rhodospirillales bacterium]
MIVLGLTGSIAMGKSTAAAMFARLGVPVFDADLTAHRLMAPRGAGVASIEAAFPGVLRGGSIDRAALAARVFGDPAALEQLESLLHPLVYAEAAAFLRRARRQRRPLVVLDIPLLYETGGSALCDLVAVVSAPARLQAARLAARPGHDRRRLAAIAARQLPDAEKRRRADIVIPTGLGRGLTQRVIGSLVDALRRAAMVPMRPGRLRGA